MITTNSVNKPFGNLLCSSEVVNFSRFSILMRVAGDGNLPLLFFEILPSHAKNMLLPFPTLWTSSGVTKCLPTSINGVISRVETRKDPASVEIFCEPAFLVRHQWRTWEQAIWRWQNVGSFWLAPYHRFKLDWLDWMGKSRFWKTPMLLCNCIIQTSCATNPTQEPGNVGTACPRAQPRSTEGLGLENSGGLAAA